MGRADRSGTYYNNDAIKPEAYPPPGHEDDDEMMKTQAFPPTQQQQSVGSEGFVHQFPPTQQSAYPQQQSVSGGIVHQFPPPPPPQQSSYGGGVHMGQPLPYGNNIQGTPMKMNPVQTQPWSSDLFDCMNDPQNALITACFPCVTFGQIAEIVDTGNPTCGTSGLMYGMIAFCIAMPCLLSCGYRTKMRNKFGLIESPGPDWVVHCFCEWCALCQEYRELQARGLDPAIGWMGNVAKQQIGMTMTPPMQQRMM